MPSSRGSSQPRKEPASPVVSASQGDSLLLSHPGKPTEDYNLVDSLSDISEELS